ncbi:MAG: ABC transporter substrate-binding protein [Pseudomonadales bacterium]|nr:ABC transporter substrate-binding protein [Pseudomonadales bacterium]
MSVFNLKQVIVLITCLLCFPFSSLAAAKKTDDALKVASINLCADQFLMLLADKKNIVALSDLAADKEYSYLWQRAVGIPLTHGDAEQLLPLKPELIVAGRYDDIHKVHLLRAFGYNVEIIPLVENLAQVTATLEHIAMLIGEEDKGLALIQDLNKRIQLATSHLQNDSSNAAKKPVAVIYAANGFTHAAGTIHDDLIRLAGFENGATQLGMTGHGNLSLEQLLMIQPDVLIMEDSSNNKNSNAQVFLQHPALTRGLPNTQVVNIPANLWMCGGPSSVDVLEHLRLIYQDFQVKGHK